MTSKVEQVNFPDLYDINLLEPNKSGFYSLCFPSSCRQPPLCDEMVSHFFLLPGNASLQFIYFTSKELAIKAWREFQVKLELCVVDQEKDCISMKNFEPEKSNSTETKETKTTQKKYSQQELVYL